LPEGKLEIKKIITELDNQIANLKEARALLVSGGAKRRGRPPGKATSGSEPRKRRLSAEGRKRISEALKRRWALRRKSSAQKS